MRLSLKKAHCVCQRHQLLQEIRGSGGEDAPPFPFYNRFSSICTSSAHQLAPWTGAPCLDRRSRGTTWVEQDGAKPLPMFSFVRTKAKQRKHLNPASRMKRADLQLSGHFVGSFSTAPYPDIRTRGTSNFQEPQTATPLPLFLNLHQFCTSARPSVSAPRTKLKLSHG
jgi:hypothetical protein